MLPLGVLQAGPSGERPTSQASPHQSWFFRLPLRAGELLLGRPGSRAVGAEREGRMS